MRAHETEPRTRSSPRRFLPLVVIVAAMAAVFLSGLYRQISLEALVENESRLRDFIDGGFLLALFVYALIYVVVVALSLPAGAVMTIAGGYLFGLVAGASATVIGATIGAAILFLVARSSFGETLAKKAGPALAKFAGGFQKDAASYLLFLRLAPVFPFALVNLASALLGARFFTFLWTTALGIIPGTLAFSSIGAGLGSLIEKQRGQFLACKAAGGSDCSLSISPSDLVTREILIAFALLALAALLPALIRRFLGRKEMPGEPSS